MWSKLIFNLIAVFLLVLTPAYAQPFAVSATGEYALSGTDTRDDAMAAAFANAKRDALTKIAADVEASPGVFMGSVTRDDIMAYAENHLRILGKPIYEFGYNGATCRAYMQVIADIDIDEIKRIKANTDKERFNDASDEYANDSNTHDGDFSADVVRDEEMPAVDENFDGNSEVSDEVENDTEFATNYDEPQSGVLKGAAEWNGHYYKIIGMPLDWEAANAFCKKMGGHLATAETAEENEKLKEIFLDNGQIDWCWIGGVRNKNNIWQWITGKTMAEYFDWAGGKPRESLQLGGPFLSLWKSKQGQWDNLKSGKHAFMCEWESASDAHDVD